ncbi:hypothetical protein [Clostridium sp. Marseille-Q7071]
MEAITNTSIQGDQLEKSKRKRKIEIFSKFTTGMAYINLTRNKNRFLATVISLSISIVLFIIVTSLSTWLDPVKNVQMDINSNYILTLDNHKKNTGYDDNVVREILDIQGITSVHKNLYFNAILKVPEDKVTESYKEKYKKIYLQNGVEDSSIKTNIYDVQIELYGCNDEELKKMNRYLDNGKLDLEDIKNNNKVILIQNQSNEKSTNLKVADKFEMQTAMQEDGQWKHYNKEVAIGALLNSLPFPTMDRRIETMVIVHEDVLRKWLNEDKYKILRINTQKDSDENYIKNELNEYAKEQENGKLISYKDELEFFKNAQRSVSVILYSFVIIIAIIGIVNIINTISMNIILRKHELGMIRYCRYGKR